ncbi:MAG: hypothetical protein LBK61_01005 [Spirochaetaceae bacterium]|jgi:hypothetical protein|nr:hypothetical protein [Spirochaetaceae bacterium]
MKFFWWCVLGLLVVRTGFGQSVLRGMVTVDAEPVWVVPPAGDDSAQGGRYPLSRRDVRLEALSAAIGYFSGMIYGWEFEYVVGEKARNVEDGFEWRLLGELPFGDVRMTPADSVVEGAIYRLWADYELDAAQSARRGAWTGGQLRVLNARGGAGLDEDQQVAFRVAAQQAVRSLVRGIERERPKVVRGRIALAKFPVITIADGEWAASAQFFVEIREIEKYKGY